jgi:serine protease Do
MKKKTFYFLIISVLIIGFLAGVVGELWVNSFLLPDPYLNFKSYSDLSSKIDDLITDDGQTKSLIEEDQRIALPINKALPAIVSIYRYRKFSPKETASLLESDYLGRGVIVTSDGWIMTSLGVTPLVASDYYVVDSENNIYVSESVKQNKKIGVSYLKIDENNLPVIEFSSKKDLIKGQNVVLFGEDGNILASRIKNLVTLKNQTIGNFLHSSETFYNYIYLQNSVDSEFFGTPVINLEGKMIGLVVDQQGTVIPIDYTFEALRLLDSDKQYAAPYLGITYYDLSALLDPTIEMKKGAKISKTGIASDSPAKGILLPGDIITKVENEEINHNKTLSELIAQYQSGVELNFTVMREDEELVVSVELK